MRSHNGDLTTDSASAALIGTTCGFATTTGRVAGKCRVSDRFFAGENHTGRMLGGSRTRQKRDNARRVATDFAVVATAPQECGVHS
jgi:hypothetical protein